MLITKIERQLRHRRRVNVFVDGAFAFGLHEEVLGRFGLRAGDTLDEHALKEIESEEEFNLAKEYALRLVSYRLRSEKEVRARLAEKEFHPAVIDRAIGHLQSSGVLNDNKFARAFVNQILMRKPSGRALLQRELRSKGIPRETIQDILHETLGEEEELHLAREAVRKILKRYRSSRIPMDEKKKQKRIESFLVRRGFQWTTIYSILRTLNDNQMTLTEAE